MWWFVQLFILVGVLRAVYALVKIGYDRIWRKYSYVSVAPPRVMYVKKEMVYILAHDHASVALTRDGDEPVIVQIGSQRITLGRGGQILEESLADRRAWIDGKEIIIVTPPTTLT